MFRSSLAGVSSTLVIACLAATNAPAQVLAPGARSIAMGFAFTGVADDVTTIKINPAGLVILTRPEVSANAEVLYPDFEQMFASYAQPFSRATVAGFVQRSGFAALDPIYSVAAGAGVKVTDQVAIGAALQYSSGNLVSQILDTGSEISFNAGILLNPNGRISLGANYQQDDVFAAKTIRGGAAFRPTDRWVFSGDVSHVTDDLGILEGTNLHFGAERSLFMGETPFFVRGGFQLDRVGDGGNLNPSAGVGIVLQKRLQIDAGIAFLKNDSDLGVISAVYRF